MDNKLEQLTQKLYDEGLAKGRAEGDKMIAEATAKAKKITAEAQAEAAEIIKKAQREAGIDPAFIKEVLLAVAKNWKGASSDKVTLSALLPADKRYSTPNDNMDNKDKEKIARLNPFMLISYVLLGLLFLGLTIVLYFHIPLITLIMIYPLIQWLKGFIRIIIHLLTYYYLSS